MDQVTSKDGTTIGFDRLGQGPPVVLVCGGSVDRMADAAIAQTLSSDFTVLNYDRRGRGDSGDTLPYAIEREVEDIEAVIDAAGGSANLWGSSSGAVLAMIATASGAPVTKLALWEPPFILDENARPPADQVEQYERMIAEGRRGDAAEYFMSKVVGMPPEFVADARNQPWWAGQEAIAHTLAYDARIMGDYSIPTETAGSVKVPTLVLAGGADMPFMRESAQALADAIPDGQVRFLDGQGARRRRDGPWTGLEGVLLLLVGSGPRRQLQEPADGGPLPGCNGLRFGVQGRARRNPDRGALDSPAHPVRRCASDRAPPRRQRADPFDRPSRDGHAPVPPRPATVPGVDLRRAHPGPDDRGPSRCPGRGGVGQRPRGPVAGDGRRRVEPRV
jgi:pimeloyl-ACP methyl ester carboxylesterase